MGEEEVAVPAAPTPAPADHKRKHEDAEPEAAERVEAEAGPNAGGGEDSETKGVADDDFSEPKRPRLDEKTADAGAGENGFQAEITEGRKEEKEEEGKKGDEQNKEAQDGEFPTKDASEEMKEFETKVAETEVQPKKDHDTADNQETSVENGLEPNKAEEPATVGANETNNVLLGQEADGTETRTHKIEVPASKVGVLIGKGGDTIRYLQYNSGAKIQILRDAEADPNSTTRPVELIGSLASTEKAEKLIHAVIAEADAGGSPSLVARGLPTTHAAGVAEQIEIQVPNDKVGLIIGRGGETIRNMQTRSGARIQLIPQHLPEGDGSKERTVRVSGDRRQIEIASDMITDVMSQNMRRSPRSGGYNQPVYRSRGPPGSPPWGSRGPHSMPYDYHHHRGSYPPHSPHYHPPSYGGYPPHHMGPRNSFGPGWDQRPPSMPGPHHGGPSYDYFGRQGSQGPGPAPPGPVPGPAMGPPPTQPGYNYGPPRGPDYGHVPPYSQTAPQPGYGPMYDNPPPVQQPYGGYGGSQPGYPQAGGQPGYPSQSRPYYGMPGPGPHAYGPPRAGQPGEMPQPPAPQMQAYGQTVAPQQQYPYASTAPPQQSYASYGTGAPSDGYNQQPLAAAGPGYQQQPVQPVSSYTQPTGYGQAGLTSGYASYPSSQPGYSEQPAQNTGTYGYQGSQDPSYGQVYTAPPNCQPTYTQTTPAQPGYEQAGAQPAAGYGATPAPASAPVGFGKSVSPQPGYPPQYDSNQMYAAPH